MFSKRVSRTSFLLSVLMLLVGLALVARPAKAAPDDFYTWAKWRLGHAPYTCQAGAPWVRPNVRRRVPPSWWKRLESYEPAPCNETTGQPVEPAPSEVVEEKLDAREEALRAAVNAERRGRGLAPLPIGAQLERAARDHAADMIRHHYLGHDWHDGTPFGTWMNRYTACTAGEIIAWQSPRQTSSNAVRQWLGSPPHRAALLASSWSAMGVELTKQHAIVEFGGACRT